MSGAPGSQSFQNPRGRDEVTSGRDRKDWLTPRSPGGDGCCSAKSRREVLSPSGSRKGLGLRVGTPWEGCTATSYGLRSRVRDGPPASGLTSPAPGSSRRGRWASEVPAPAREPGLAGLLKRGTEVLDAWVRHYGRLGLRDECPGVLVAAATPHLGRGESGPRCGAGGGRLKLLLPLAATAAHILFPPAGGRGRLPARPPQRLLKSPPPTLNNRKQADPTASHRPHSKSREDFLPFSARGHEA